MVSSTHIFEPKKVIGVILFLLIYLISNAQDNGAPQKNISSDLAQHGYSGIIIVVSILGLSIIAFIISNIIEKRKKGKEKPNNKQIYHSVNRHHNGHRIVKKSN